MEAWEHHKWWEEQSLGVSWSLGSNLAFANLLAVCLGASDLSLPSLSILVSKMERQKYHVFRWVVMNIKRDH